MTEEQHGTLSRQAVIFFHSTFLDDCPAAQMIDCLEQVRNMLGDQGHSGFSDPRTDPYNQRYVLELTITLSISTDGPSVFVTVEQYTLLAGPLTSAEARLDATCSLDMRSRVLR